MSNPITGSNHYLHIDLDRTDYTVNEDDLKRISEAAKNDWKDFFLVSLPTGVVFIINAIADTKEPFKLTLGLFLNYLFGVLCILGAVVFGIMWFKTKKNMEDVITTIKNKPKMMIKLTGEGNIRNDGGEIETIIISS